MASQNPKIIAQDVHRVVSLFKQAGHAATADTDVTGVAHEAPSGSPFPAGDFDAIFTAPFEGLARIAFALSATAVIKVTESADGGSSVVTHTLNDGNALQADVLTFPVRQGYRYAFQVGSGVSVYSLTIDCVRE